MMLLVSCRADAQSLSSSVIASGGGSASAGNAHMSYTVGETTIHSFASSSNSLTQGFQQPEVDLKSGNIYIDTVCAGDEIAVSFTAHGIIGSNNVFTAQLSDASGSFASPVNVGTTIGNSSGIVTALIPANTPPGNGYRLRIISSLPVLNSESQTVLTMHLCVVSLGIRLFIEGYYAGGMMQSPLYNTGLTADPAVCDTVVINLHDVVSPFVVVSSDTIVIDTNGYGNAEFPSFLNGSTNYISINNRSAIETWSKQPVTLGTVTNFDFTVPD